MDMLAEAKRILDGREYLTYDELEEGVRETLMDDYQVDDYWDEPVMYNLSAMLTSLGVHYASLHYSGFSSQGDGAHFTGSYRYAKGAAAKCKAERPGDLDLHGIIDDLQALQRRYFYRLTADISHRGHYQHENCAVIECSWPEAGAALAEILRRLMRYCYGVLEAEYEYQTGEGAEEYLCSQQFNEDGSYYEGG